MIRFGLFSPHFGRFVRRRPGPRLRWSKTQPGTTLPELLVGIFVLGLIVVVVGNLYVGSGQFTRDEGLRIDVGENAARLLAVADETLRQGKSVQDTVSLGGVDYDTGSDTLVFTLPSLLSDGTLSPTEVDTAVLFLDSSLPTNKRWWLKLQPAGSSVRPAVDRAVVEKVKDVYFRYTTPVPGDATGITITLTVTDTINQRVFTRANILYAVFRNHL